MCAVTGKIAYPNPANAYRMLMAKRAIQRNLPVMRAYQCPHCHNWHLTKGFHVLSPRLRSQGPRLSRTQLLALVARLETPDATVPLPKRRKPRL